jgi:hypothetical protein
MQPFVTDDKGVYRFVKNEIVRYLLDAGGLNLNQLNLRFSDSEDWDQFYQLIGYSLVGYFDLNVSDDAKYKVWKLIKQENKKDKSPPSL